MRTCTSGGAWFWRWRRGPPRASRPPPFPPSAPLPPRRAKKKKKSARIPTALFLAAARARPRGRWEGEIRLPALRKYGNDIGLPNEVGPRAVAQSATARRPPPRRDEGGERARARGTPPPAAPQCPAPFQPRPPSLSLSHTACVTTTSPVLASTLPRVFEEVNGRAVAAAPPPGGGPAGAATTLGGDFAPDDLDAVAKDATKKLEAEVLAPMQRWLTAFATVGARMKRLEGVRLEVDSRRRTVVGLGSRVDAQRLRLPHTRSKGEWQMEQTIKKMQHKENKLAGALRERGGGERGKGETPPKKKK